MTARTFAPLSILALLVSVAAPAKALGENCTFDYWQVIPRDAQCPVYHLPDFEFRTLPPDPTGNPAIRRFCTQYGVHSKFGEQRTGYCYTGEGDRMGPSFVLGDDAPDALLKRREEAYFADLNFVGCRNGVKTEGIVFGKGGWTKAPKGLSRLWPVESLGHPERMKCGREQSD